VNFWKRLRRKRREQDLDEEIQHHLAAEIQERIQTGALPQEADRSARRDFGNLLLVKEIIRDTWRWNSLAALGQDVRYGVRMMSRAPILTVVVVLSLALGIGANTAIFSLLNAVILRMLPVKDAGELVYLTHGAPAGRPEFSYPAFQQIRELNQVFDGVLGRFGTARYDAIFTTSGADQVIEELVTEAVSGNYFSVLGVNPILGRAFTSADDGLQAVDGAVISYGYWSRRFALDPGAIGKTFTLNRVPVTIIGIAPQRFFGEIVGQRPDVWITLSTLDRMDPGSNMLRDRRWAWLRLMARRKPGVSEALARAATEVLYQQINQFPGDGSVQLRPGGKGYGELREQFSEPLLILMAVTGLVLLIACANVGTLLLSRASARRKEIALRLAVGAGRGRLFRQLLTESLLLASLGGIVGWVFSRWAGRVLLTMASVEPTPIGIDLMPDLRVLAFTAGVSLLVGILLGVAPALWSTDLDPGPVLKDVQARPRYGRLGLDKVLVISQIAVSTLLLVGAGLFVHTLQNLKDISASFGWEHVTQAQFGPLPHSYSQAETTAIYQRLLDRVTELPGVRSASLSLNGFHNGSGSLCCIAIPGYIPGSNADSTVLQNQISLRYFETLGIALLRGRDFLASEVRLPPTVAIINEAAARKYFNNQDPVGRRFRLRGRNFDYTLDVVGLVKDAKFDDLREQPKPMFYMPNPRGITPPFIPNHSLEVRAFGTPDALAAAIRATAQSVDKNLKMASVDTLTEIVDRTLVQERLIAKLSSFFGGLALLLVCIGLYGTMSYMVVRRTCEIGIRMALGAQRKDVLRLVMRDTVLLVVAGMGLGIPASFVAQRWIKSQLFGLSKVDPSSIVVAVGLMLSFAIIADYLPARRAYRVDPIAALRHE
jgi:predicted permease